MSTDRRSAPTLLAVFAHPDDEVFGTGGTLARAVDSGATVALVCATRGEVGEIADPHLATPETLPTVRERELRASCHVLGFTDVRFLGYRDSGMAGTPDNEDPRAFAQSDPNEVVGQLVRIMRELRPHVVVTFDPTGGYGHPDHIAICKHTTAAFDLAGDPAAFPEAGPPHAAQRLYYTVVPRGAFRDFVRQAAAAGVELGFLRNAEVDTLGVPDEQVSATVDVTPWLARKKGAFEAHATQKGSTDPLTALPNEWRDRFLATECFQLVRGTAPAAGRTDLLAGLGSGAAAST